MMKSLVTKISLSALISSLMLLFFVNPVAAEEELSGRQLYQVNCALCHKSGLNGAPKYGENRAWETILANGKEKVYDNAINGIGAMPGRGGKDLTDEQVKAAVDFMIGAVGGWE